MSDSNQRRFNSIHDKKIKCLKQEVFSVYYLYLGPNIKCLKQNQRKFPNHCLIAKRLILSMTDKTKVCSHPHRTRMQAPQHHPT